MSYAMGLIVTVLAAMFVFGLISMAVLVVAIGLSAGLMLLVGALMGDGEEGRG